MPNLFVLIGESWDFCRKQQAITHVAMWFILLPIVTGGILEHYHATNAHIVENSPELRLSFGLATIALSLVTMWGTVCILSIGKRLLQAKSGRTRSSFKTVRVQSRPLFIPFVLTSILRGIMILLWASPLIGLVLFFALSNYLPLNETGDVIITPQLGLIIAAAILLAIPAIIYSIRTSFFAVAAVCEGIFYRPALKRSIDITRGHLWQVVFTLVGLSIVTLIPAQILGNIFSSIAKEAPLPIVLSATIASGIIMSVATVIYILSIIQAYGYFRPSAHVTNA